MPVNKQHDEFYTLDMTTGWEVPTGYPQGIKQKIISGALDEENRRGSRTRLLRFDAGTYTTKPFEHEYWEEVYLVSGETKEPMTDKPSRRSFGNGEFKFQTKLKEPFGGEWDKVVIYQRPNGEKDDTGMIAVLEGPLE